MGGTQQVCSPGQDSPGMAGRGGAHCAQDRLFVCTCLLFLYIEVRCTNMLSTYMYRLL